MEIAMARLDGKGRLLLPKKMRERIGIREKTVVFIYTFEKLVFIGEAKSDKAEVLDSIRRLGAKPPAFSLD